jgi:glycosyltransferase involved in cell wall biosynthesis
MILLSICIPTYNGVKTLAEALDSLLLQIAEESDVEILVSDNASTDGTQALVQRYIERYPFIRYERNAENVGFDGNIVACLEKATGEYVWFFSDDDIAPPHTAESVKHMLTLEKPALLYLNHVPFLGNNLSMRLRAKLPSRNEVFRDGKKFLLFGGLGFISALVIKTSYGRRYTAMVKHGPGQAHLDVAARVALLEAGPFVYLGTRPIAARVPDQARYDEVTSAAINEAIFFHGLEASGILDSKSVRYKVGLSVRHNLLRAVLRKKCAGDYRHLASQKQLLVDTYGRYPSFFFLVYPILILPRELLIWPFFLTKRVLNLVRRHRLPSTIE